MSKFARNVVTLPMQIILHAVLALVVSVFVTGTGASAGDFARHTPPPSQPRQVPVGDFSSSERPGDTQYTVVCLGSTACNSLRAWCGKEGGTFTDFVGPSGTKGLCSKTE